MKIPVTSSKRKVPLRNYLRKYYYNSQFLKFIHQTIGQQILGEFIRCFCFCLFFPASILLRLLRFRVIEHGCNIGNLCTQIDACVKEKLLQRIPNYNLVIYPYSRFRLKTANNYLFQLWKQHCFVLTNPILAGLCRFIFTSPWLKIERPYFSKYPQESYYAVNREYHSKFPRFSKENPILKIPEKDKNKGWEILKKLGISQSDWFVCFFAREDGFYGSNDLKDQGVIRNVDVGTYEKALLEVTQRGGWCIRMGSANMAPLPERLRNLPRVIDYPKTCFVSDYMDVFLVAMCKFMLTSGSGFSYLPGLFGIPIVATNLITFNEAKPLYPSDIAIVKKIYSKKLKRLLSFPEIFSSYVADHYLSYYFDAFQLELVANTEDEIYEAVKEMLDRLNRSYEEKEEYSVLQKKFDEQIPQCMYCKDSLGKMGDHFLKTHEQLL